MKGDGPVLSGKILVVDDEPGLRRSLAVLLRRASYEVTEAGSVSEAVGRLGSNPCDLVIADLMMEPLSGLDLLATIRECRMACPVVIITGYGTPEARSAALRLGAVDVLDKPLASSDLLLRIRGILDGEPGGKKP